MERKSYLKYFLRFCCLISVVFCLASNSFSSELYGTATQNLKFSIRMFPIPQTFRPEQMYISYHGVSVKKRPVCINGQVEDLQEKKSLEQSKIHNSRELGKVNGLHDRLSYIADFLLRYITIDAKALTEGGENTGNSSANRYDKKNMKFEFEATPTDLSGAVFFVMQI